MKKYKNTELAKQYKVSEKTVRNWINSSLNKNLNLQLVKEESRAYIADTPSNHLIMKELSEKGRKYQSKKTRQVIFPKKEFYELFNSQQIIDIVKNVENNREIPHKYSYFNGGADSWSKYVEEVMASNAPITSNKTKLALGQDKEYIYDLIKEKKGVNVVDIGPGNGMPIREFLEFLKTHKLLQKYIAVDYSPDILKIVKKNITEWFNGEVEVECYQKDITQENLQELLFMNSEPDVPNLVLFIGTTIENQMHYDHTLANLKVGLGPNDIFFLGQLLEDEKASSRLEFYSENKVTNLDDIEMELMVPRLLGLDASHFEVNRFFKTDTKSWIITLRFKYDIEIKFEFSKIKKSIFLNKLEDLVIFRHNYHSIFEVINKLGSLGFDILHINTSNDLGHMLCMSKIKSKTPF
jgi:uncharacterized SAM-dependent methyltransferase